MKHYTPHRKSKEQPGFQEESTKRPARMASKKATRPAPKREKKPIKFGPENLGAQNHGGSSGSTQGKSDKGKRLRREKLKLERLKQQGARPRSIKRLEATINRRENNS